MKSLNHQSSNSKNYKSKSEKPNKHSKQQKPKTINSSRTFNVSSINLKPKRINLKVSILNSLKYPNL